MKVTKEVIKSLETGNGGFNKKTLSLFGVKWPPKKGWQKKILGKEIDPYKYNELLSLKHGA